MDVLEAAHLWSSETEDMTAVALEVDSVLLTEGNGTVIDVQEGNNLANGTKLLWNVDVEQGEYSLDLYGMRQWGSQNATIYINNQYATSLNMWGNSTDIINFVAAGSYTIEIRNLGAPKNSHAGSGVISLNRITGSGISGTGSHFGEATSKNSFTAGVRRALPGEDLEERVSFGTKMDVIRDLVSLKRFGGGEIEANKEAWIVIHGRESYASASTAVKNTENENNMYRLAEALEAFESRKPEIDRFQIIVADWRSFAGSNSPELFGMQGSHFIVPVAQVMGENLSTVPGGGIPNSKLNIVAHSWGTLVGYELGKSRAGMTQSFVSLDTATNNILAAMAGGGYDSGTMDFRTVTQTSWAFEGSAYGDNERSAKADITIQMEFPFAALELTRHRLVVEAFTQLINEQVSDADDALASKFSLQLLTSGITDEWPWMTNGAGSLLPEGYEGNLSSSDTGIRFRDGTPIYQIEYLKYRKSDGTIDVIEPS